MGRRGRVKLYAVGRITDATDVIPEIVATDPTGLLTDESEWTDLSLRRNSVIEETVSLADFSFVWTRHFFPLPELSFSFDVAVSGSCYFRLNPFRNAVEAGLKPLFRDYWEVLFRTVSCPRSISRSALTVR